MAETMCAYVYYLKMIGLLWLRLHEHLMVVLYDMGRQVADSQAINRHVFS